MQWDASMAEVMAAKCGVLWPHNLGYINIELEVDALNLAKAIVARKVDRSPLDLIMEEFCVLGDSFESFNIFHVKRVGNYVAHIEHSHKWEFWFPKAQKLG